MNKLIIGITGQMASGKTTIAEYIIEKYGATSHRFSTPLRDILNRIYVENTRENLQKLSEPLRAAFGEDTLAKVIAHDVQADTSHLIVVDGVRRPADVAYLKDVEGFILLALTAEMKIRYERLTQRTENVDDQNKTFEQFQKDHEQEPEQKIDEVSQGADITLENNGSVEDLFAQVDALLKQYGH